MALNNYQKASPSTVIASDERDPYVSWQHHLNRTAGARGGVDIVAAIGTPVIARTAGTMRRVPNNGSAGNSCRFEHDSNPGWHDVFSHLSTYVGVDGQHFNAGDVVAYTGNTGNVAEHLHWHLVDPSGVRRNPWDYFSPSAPSSTDSAKAAMSVLGRGETMDVYWRGSDSNPTLYHRYNVGNGWSGNESLGGSLKTAPTVVSTGTSTHDVFYGGTDNKLHHNWFTGANWAGDSVLPTLVDIAGRPSVVRRPDGTINVFYRNVNGGLCQSYFQNGAWAVSPVLASNLASDPFAVITNAGVDVFFAGANRALQHVYQANGGPWQPATALPQDGPLAGTPTAVVRAARINVFWRGDGSTLRQSYFDGTAWQATGTSLATNVSGDPVAVVSGSTVDVAYASTNGTPWHVWYSTNWSTPSQLPSTSGVASPMALIYRSNGFENLFWRGVNGTITQSYAGPNGVWASSVPM